MPRANTYPFPQTPPSNDFEYVTQPLADQETPQLSVEDQLTNAQRVVGALHASISHLRRQTRDQAPGTPIDTTTASMPDITRSIIRGRPITLEPTDMVMASGSDQEPLAPGLHLHDKLARSLGYLLRDIAPHPQQIGYVTPVLDGYSSIWRATLGMKHDARNALYSDETRRKIVLDVWNMHKEQGIIELSDIAGQNYTIAPTSPYIDNTDRPGAIIHDLRHSAWGEVSTDKSGALVFHTSPELQSLYPNGLGSQTVRLTDQFGLETSTTLYAEATRKTLRQRDGLHIMGPNSRVHEAALLLRAVENINRQRYHSIGVRSKNWHGTTPERYALDIALELEQHAQEFIINRERFADFKDFDPKEYAERWYDSEEKPLVDDQDICRTVGFVLWLLGMHVGRAVDLGSGPNAYPAMLSLPYAEHLDLLDYAPSNRAYMNAFLTGTAPQRQMQMWDKFVPYMMEGGGAIYEDITTHIRERAQRGDVTVQPCDVFDLQGMWGLMLAFFLIESISTYPEDQHLALASMTKSLESEGLMIVGSMLNQKGHVGYKAGVDKEYPNLSQTTAEMERAFLDNNLYPVIIRLGRDKRKMRDGYDGMVLTFACHKDSERQQQLINMIPELRRQGFDVVA